MRMRWPPGSWGSAWPGPSARGSSTSVPMPGARWGRPSAAGRRRGTGGDPGVGPLRRSATIPSTTVVTVDRVFDWSHLRAGPSLPAPVAGAANGSATDKRCVAPSLRQRAVVRYSAGGLAGGGTRHDDRARVARSDEAVGTVLVLDPDPATGGKPGLAAMAAADLAERIGFVAGTIARELGRRPHRRDRRPAPRPRRPGRGFGAGQRAMQLVGVHLVDPGQVDRGLPGQGHRRAGRERGSERGRHDRLHRARGGGRLRPRHHPPRPSSPTCRPIRQEHGRCSTSRSDAVAASAAGCRGPAQAHRRRTAGALLPDHRALPAGHRRRPGHLAGHRAVAHPLGPPQARRALAVGGRGPGHEPRPSPGPGLRPFDAEARPRPPS